MDQSFLQKISQPKQQKAWVVFSGQADISWLKILKPGYRHCYIVMNDGDHWFSIDPLSSHTEIMVHHIAPDFDLPAWLRSRGLEVIASNIYNTARQAPWGIFTCVEAVKRVLGIHKFWIMTPWQLRQQLIKTEYLSPQLKKQTA